MAAPTTTNGVRRTQSAPAPPPVRSPARGRTRVAAGAALMIVCAFAAAVLYADAGEREPILVMTDRVAAGEVITGGDIGETLAAVDDAGAVVPAADRSRVVGRIAVVDLVAGSVVSPSQVSDRAPEASTSAVVAARLDEGRAPAGLAVGDAVLLYEVPSEGDDAGATSTPVAGRVVGVETAADGSAVVVSVAVDAADARRAAVAAARGRVTLVLAPS